MSLLLLWVVLFFGGAASADSCVDLGGTESDKDSCISSLGGRYVWYNDEDFDLFAAETICCCPSSSTCDRGDAGDIPDGYEFAVARSGVSVLHWDDCLDSDPSVNPAASETWYNGLDEDCGGTTDFDQDGDGWFVEGYTDYTTATPGSGEVVSDGSESLGEDCDDTDADISPDGTEVPNTKDDDCDGVEDEGTSAFDDDGDCACEDESCTDTVALDCVVLLGGDCDDDDPAVAPDAEEIWYDGLDQNCDGASDYDQDADGAVPDAYVGLPTTVAATGEVVESGDLPGGDCDDSSAAAGPGAPESWYDGLDSDCAEDDDYDQDGDGYVPDAYAGLPTTGADGTPLPGSGSLPSGDCDDADAEFSPGAAEIFYDGLDQDCDGGCDYDQDGDGYNIDPALLGTDSIPDTTASDGTVVCAADALPDGDCIDDLETLLELAPLSTKDPADIHPDLAETCELRDTPQIDDDCNGNTNTQGEGSEESYITSDWGTPYYEDADGDGQGNPDVYYYLCEEVDGFTTSFGDCDDSNADVNPDAPELCNNADEDCDGQVDEASSLGSESGCIDLYPDEDLDGYGSTAVSTCMCYDGSSDECGDGYEYNDEDEICYTRTYGDCYDYDSSIHPLDDGEPVVEYLDGNDNDCNRELPLVELDCDDDGSLPLLPVEVDASTAVASAADLGLTDCRGPSGEADPDCCLRGDCEAGETCDDVEITEFATCWGEYRLRLKCDEDTGLQVVSQVADGVAERFDGGRRLYAEGRACNTSGDCDDHCAARCPDAEEICDGVDNDCQDAADLLGDEDLDGLPDPLDEDDLVPGYVNIHELDLDADGYLGCAEDDLVSRDQSAISVAACSTSDALSDCDDTCSLASPVVAEERCDAFLNVCEGEVEGADADRDAYLSCGAWGPEDVELAEDIYALVYVPGITAADTADSASSTTEEVVPLLLPRPEAEACDTTLRETLGSLVGEETLRSAVNSADPEPLLRLCVAAEACRQMREGTALDWPADCAGLDGACTVARLTLSPDADDALYDDDVVASLDADCSDHPEQRITRSVWSRARVLAARALVVQWECFRLNGSYGCGDLPLPDGWQSPFPDGQIEGGNVANVDPGEALEQDGRWWKELGRYAPRPALGELLAGCWGEPDPGSDALSDVLSARTGGDCADGDGASNRGQAEGPDDLLGIYEGDPARCETCTDGKDNNCNGLMDCAEPACARCFVGQGAGCGGGEQSPCAESGCSSAPRDDLGDPDTLVLVGLSLLSLGSALWRRR